MRGGRVAAADMGTSEVTSAEGYRARWPEQAGGISTYEKLIQQIPVRSGGADHYRVLLDESRYLNFNRLRQKTPRTKA